MIAPSERHRISRFKCVFTGGEIVEGERSAFFLNFTMAHAALGIRLEPSVRNRTT